MDIKDIKKSFNTHSKGVEVQMKSPLDGQPTTVFITVLGPDSKEWRRAEHNALTKLLQIPEEERKEKAEDIDMQQVASVIVGWRGLSNDGKPYEYSPERAVELMRLAPYIFQQLNRFLGNRVNFTKS